jgi:hypothetical protein
MAYAALCSALIGMAAWCADAVVASMRRPRRITWIAAIAASIVAPLALPLRPPASPPPSQSVARNDPTTLGGQPKASSSYRTDIVVLTGWAIASGAFALVLLIAHRRTTSALKQCRRASVGGTEAFVSRDFGPAVVGVLHHHVVVPSWTLGLSDDEQRLVVAHELEHARSGDPLLALAGVSALVVMPWNLALWWQLSRLRLAIELDCDARVVGRKFGDTLAYSRLLVSVGERALATRQPVLAMSRSRSALAKRFDALLSRDALKPRRALALSFLAAGTVASVAFLPSPKMSEVVGAIKARQPAADTAVAFVQTPTNRAAFTASTTSQVVAGVVQRRAPRQASAQPRNRLAAIGDASSLPPVNVVPSSQRGPLDSVVVTSAARPPLPTFRGGFITAAPGGGGRGGGARSGATATATPIGPDSNRVIRGGRGGRAMVTARPDTTTSPR